MKRFWVTTGIVFGLVLLFIVGLGVILMLSPGSRIFGLQYVSAFIGKNDVTEAYSDYIDGDIYITSNDIPVVLSIEPYGKTSVEFSQHYHGFTTDKTNIPNCKIERTTQGLEIETAEIGRFLIFGRNDKYSLTVRIPASWATSGRHSIYVNGKNSPITINNADDTTLSFINLSLLGNNSLTINTKLTCKNLTAYTRNAAEFNKNIVAENYDISSNGASLTFGGTIEGNLTAKTTNGYVHFYKVKGDVNIKTSSGEVAGIENNNPIVYGNANIETGRGRVVIDELLSSNNTIKTAGGSVTINTMIGGTINADRATITIGDMVSGTINGGVKDVKIGSVSNSATIVSTKGNIYVGNEANAKTAKNIIASSTNGKITATNTVGSVKLTTTNGDVVLKNKSANDIKIDSAKTVTATGLMGNVNVSAKKDISLTFSAINGNVNVDGSAGCHNININATQTNLSSVNVYLSTTKGGNARVYQGDTLKEEGLNVSPASPNSTLKNIKVNAPNCAINLYLKAA